MTSFKQFGASMIAFSVLLTGMIHFMGGVFGTFGVNPNDQVLEQMSQDVDQETSNTVTGVRKQTKQVGNPGRNVLGAAGFFLSGLWGVIQSLFNLILLIPNIATTIIVWLGLPAWTTGFIGIPTLVLFLHVVDVAQGDST